MADDIVIVDYGLANLRSVQKAFETIDVPAVISSDPSRIASADKIVLPGVGAFRDAIARLHESGLAGTIRTQLDGGVPFLGICLGYQLLFDRSHEDGVYDGLGIFPGEVVAFAPQPGLKIPHMGWNTLDLTRPECPLFAGLPPEPSFYFVHSYYPNITDSRLVAATADYPTPFPAVVWKSNIFATQFHPEKSQANGLRLLQNFAELR